MVVGAVALDFFGDLGDRCGHEGGTAPGSGARCGSSPHLCVMRVVAAVPAKISDLRLGVGGRRRGGLPIYLIKKAVLGFVLINGRYRLSTWCL
jgi:hypothetical protein